MSQCEKLCSDACVETAPIPCQLFLRLLQPCAAFFNFSFICKSLFTQLFLQSDALLFTLCKSLIQHCYSFCEAIVFQSMVKTMYQEQSFWTKCYWEGKCCWCPQMFYENVIISKGMAQSFACLSLIISLKKLITWITNVDAFFIWSDQYFKGML